MKEMQFTTEELQDLVLALNTQLSQVRMRNIKQGKPMMNESAERVNNMCSRAYALLIEALSEECGEIIGILE